MTDAVDLRLVPAAVTAWGVTGAAITWAGAGPVLAAVCTVAGVGWWLAAAVTGGRYPVLRAAAVGVAGVAAVGAGFALAAGLRGDAVEQHPLSRRFGSTAEVTVLPTETPRAVGSGRVMFRADLLDDGDVPGARVVAFGAAHHLTGLTAGQPVRFRARVSRPARRDLTVAVLTVVGRPDFGEASTVQRAAAAVRARLAAAARESLPAGQAAILPGLVLGDTSAVPAGTVAQFRTAGLTHLTAVSGANVTIVCGAVLLAAGGLCGPRVAAVLAGAALVAFVVVVQPSASVLRAAAMGAIALMAVFSARRRQAIPVLAAAVIVLMLLAPQLAVDAGFALSVSATAALAVLAPVWSARLVRRGWPKPLADAVTLAVAAQLVTTPLIAAISGQFSLVAVIANICVAPVVPPITVLGTAAAALAPVWPAGAGLLLRFTGPELWWLLAVARTAGSLPGAAVAIPDGWAGLIASAAAVLVAVVLWRYRWFRFTAAAAGLGALAWSLSGLVGAA